ncbi:LPXTG cell wall anchor domain-containing protein [Nocardioides ultimimeridianus]
MFGRLITYIATGLVAVLVIASGGAASGYGNGVSTSCNVSVSAKAGKPISAYIDVKGNASTAVTGDVTISVSRVGNAARAARATTSWSKTVHYNGTPLSITGPVLKNGAYRAVASFSADPGVYLDCQCFGRFSTKSVAGEHHNNGGGGGGGLPNTGGPSEWWLIAGFGLVLVGGAATYTARRRRVAAHA